MARMWVMFLTSLLLVMTMNFYAVVREPELVPIEDLPEYPMETVKIEGILTSWIRDPYGDGDDRIDMQVMDKNDGYTVAEVRWVKNGYINESNIPAIGSIVYVEGEIVEWNGSIWLQSSGRGAVYAKAGADVNPTWTSLSELARDPLAFDGESITVEAYVGKSIAPNITRQSFYLQDNPSYSNADHMLYVRLEGRVMDQYEAGSKVRLTGWVLFDSRNLRYQMFSQSSTLQILHEAGPAQLRWSANAMSLSYDVGKLVTIDGTLQMEGENLMLRGPTADDALCAIIDHNGEPPLDEYRENWTGRLQWSDSKATICMMIDLGEQPEPDIPNDGVIPLDYIAMNPFLYANSSHTVEGWMSNPICPDYLKGYVQDAPEYTSGMIKLRIELSGERSKCIEAGQAVRMVGTIVWDVEDARVIIRISEINLTGPTPGYATLTWGETYADWRWEENKIVKIQGIIEAQDNGTTQTLRQAGTDRSICLIGDGTEASQFGDDVPTLDWRGRLILENDMGGTSSAWVCLDIRGHEQTWA